MQGDENCNTADDPISLEFQILHVPSPWIFRFGGIQILQEIDCPLELRSTVSISRKDLVMWT